ncbi:flavodoxin domain-containing protein [Auritidibacter ignavus]|uniref:flavodoxin domain-containing protein n=1 Tax=Auritidibacter ignavus TaxID=678932 RepID=UPI00109CE3FB|nr:flavodoxin domain-containing protein [Auritidibacter ignavus]
MATIVTCDSRHHSTREIADYIVEVLRTTNGSAAVFAELDEVGKNIDNIDALVVLAPIYQGKFSEAASRVILANQAELARKSLFVAAVGIAEQLPQDVSDVLTSYRPRELGYFRGKIDPSVLSGAEKRHVDESEYGDFRDWDAIKGWAQTIGNRGAN